MPTSESDPIEPDESLLRRVHVQQVPGGPPFTDGATRPNTGDTDGFSLYRARFCDVLELVAMAPSSYYVVRFAAYDVLHLLEGTSLTLRAKPNGKPAGHSIIDGLTLALKRENRQLYKATTGALATLANASGGIARYPT